MPDSEAARARSRLQRLAWLLDSAIALPGGFRIGVDGLLGLLPGVGDAFGAVLSSYILVEAARLGAPGSVLGRMGVNVLLELVVGVVPVAGDLFDIVFKANERNVKLLEAHFAEPRRVARRSRAELAAIVAGIVVLATLLVWLMVRLVVWLWQLVAA